MAALCQLGDKTNCFKVAWDTLQERVDVGALSFRVTLIKAGPGRVRVSQMRAINFFGD